MSKSDVKFERWVPREGSTWPFQVFRKYDLELQGLYWSFEPAAKHVYAVLGKSGAKWPDRPEKHLPFHPRERARLFDDVKRWSLAFNAFANWTRLNALVAITSNLETFLAAVIQLALESDPGLLLGASESVDGMALLKAKGKPLDYEKQIEACTKRDWSSRVAAFESLFGSAPAILKDKLSDLDSMRILRNKVGHAFGRDIAKSRQHGVREIMPMGLLSKERLERYQRIAWSAAKQIDRQLLMKHIGEYQAIHFYHKLYPSLRKDVHPSERAIVFKKELGRFKAPSAGKLFCKGLVAYYESL
jgi:hypothetical protein